MIRIGLGVGALVVALVCGGLPAGAETLTFLGEDAGSGETTALTSTPNALQAETDFLAYLSSSTQTETFESFTAGQTNIGTTFAGSGSSTITAAINGTYLNRIATVTSGTDGYGRYAVSGTDYYDALTTVNILFTSDVSAFGFWGVDVGDFSSQLRVVTTDSSNVSRTYDVGNSTGVSGGGVIFWGLLTDDSFRRIQIQTLGATSTSSFDRFALDDLTIGDRDQIVKSLATPEPASLVLVAGGALGLVLRRRRSRR